MTGAICEASLAAQRPLAIRENLPKCDFVVVSSALIVARLPPSRPAFQKHRDLSDKSPFAHMKALCLSLWNDLKLAEEQLSPKAATACVRGATGPFTAFLPTSV